MEQLVFIGFVGAVALLRFLMQLAEKKRNAESAKRARPTPQTNAPVPRAPVDSEEERVRKFFEALGVPPPPNAPPPKTPPRRVVPKTARSPKPKIMPVDPFPIPRAELPRQQEESAPLPLPPIEAAPPPLPIAPPATQGQRTVPNFEVADIEWGKETEAVASSAAIAQNVASGETAPAEQSWATRLANPQSLRDAIVLREIFGPPRGAQLFEFTATER